MDNPVTPPHDQSPATPTNEDELLQRAMAELEAELPATPSGTVTQEQIEKDRNSGLLGAVNQAIAPPQILDAAASGVLEAGMETKDFIFGEPEDADKSLFRQAHEANSKEIKQSGSVNSAAYSISQMVAGLVGAGKLMRPFKFLQGLRKGSKVARAGYEVGKGALASTVVLDPHEERLSDLVEEYPALQNPVTDYLQSDPQDSTAEGRFKNAVESIGLDFALIGAVKVVKLLRAGRQDDALKEIKKLETETTASVDRVAETRGRLVEEPTQQTTTAARTESPAPDGTQIAPTPANAATEASGVKQADVAKAGMSLSDDDLGAILKSSRDEDAAIRKYGSREAATEAGQVAARTSSLPWQKLRGTPEVMDFVNQSARVLKSQMDEAKGGAVLSDTKLSEMVTARAELFGEDPMLVMGQIREAGEAASTMAANMEASFLIANRMMGETYDLAFRVRNGMLDDWGGDAARASEELKARLAASADLLANARSMASNSGRALRRLRGQHQFSVEDLAKVKDMDGEKLADLIFQSKGDPKKLAQIANPTFLRRVMDEGAYSLTNSLLWLYPTHVTNITSSLIMLAGRPTEKLLGSLAIAPKAGGDIIRQQALREYAFTVGALGDAWTAMKDAFVRGDSILSPHNTEFFQGGGNLKTTQQALPWRPIEGISDLAYNAVVSANYRNIVGLPTRALGAVDEFFKTLRFRAYVQAEAAVKARAQGLTGDDFERFVRERMEAAIDPATGQALDQKALREAQITTFQQDLLPGTVGSSIQMMRSRHPALVFVLPFVKTPINVLRYGWKVTPGINLLQKEFRDNLRGINGSEAKAHAVGQMALGSTFMALSATMALNGKLTGGGPSDPKLQKELRAAGWQPYSYIIDRPDGAKTYIPMGKLDPASMALSMTADLVEAMRHDPEGTEAEKGIGALALALAKNFSDKTFLQNMHKALEALSDTKGDKGEKYLANLAGNTIPMSSLLRGVNPDPYMREARTFIDTMLKNMPGYSERLPPTRDVFGEPLVRRIAITSSTEADTVESEVTRIMLETEKAGVGRPDPGFEGLDLRDITLENGQNAYDRLQELGGQLPGRPSLKAHLARLINSQAYQDLPDGDSDVKGTRLHALGKYVQQYREGAKNALLRLHPELRPYIKQRQRDARGAFIKNRQQRLQGDPSAQELLEALRGQD
ncbi:hypothetical protein [Agrobacterium rosae]|uniref:hypothetical protein n=1 Tax=Agrobacterium rosae TaxID=1972867 RepID=UPI000CD99683|nr:hypothetical protein [Agrobacterium rosae]POO56170.1 hypothetical protein CTT39_05335 [Agrobacterium rosae]